MERLDDLQHNGLMLYQDTELERFNADALWLCSFLRAGAKVICCAVVVNNAIAGGHFAVLRPLPTFNGLQLFLRPAPVCFNPLSAHC